jgi:hypothetical protein
LGIGLYIYIVLTSNLVSRAENGICIERQVSR